MAAANGIYLAGLQHILDPMLAMDPLYIQLAQRPVAGILAEPAAWGPLYALWLKPLVAAFGDPLAVYAANLRALSLAVSSAVYLHVLLVTGRAAVAVGAAVFFLVSDFNVPLPSKVSSFALLVVLGGLTLSLLLPAGSRRLSVMAAGVLLSSYARPEMYPAALCLALAALWLALRERPEGGTRAWLWPAAVAALVVFLALSIGAPIFGSSGGDRFFIAFREHFAWNWTRWHGRGRYFGAIWEEEFGAAQTVVQALLANPSAVGRHVADNLLGTIRFLLVSAFAHYPVLLPASSPFLAKAEAVLAACVTFGSLAFVSRQSHLRRRLLARWGDLLVVYLLLAVFPLAAAAVIFPVTHYLIIPAALLMIAGAVAASLIVPAGGRTTWRRCAVAAVICLAVTPRPFVLPSAYETRSAPFKGRISVKRPIAETIEVIRSWQLPQPVRVLTFTDGIGELLGSGFEEIKVWQKGAQPLEEYIRDHRIDVIVTREAGRESFMVDDPFWERVQTSPRSVGFARVAGGDDETVRIWVRADLVDRSP